MGGRYVIEVTDDQIARDLAQKLMLFPALPWILVNRTALKFREMGREQALSSKGSDTLGEADPWKTSRSKSRGDAKRKSFIYSIKPKAGKKSKFVTAYMSHPLANIWESQPRNRRVKKRIPFLTAFGKKFKQANIAEMVVAEALENIARTGKP